MATDPALEAVSPWLGETTTVLGLLESACWAGPTDQQLALWDLQCPAAWDGRWGSA